MNEEMKEEKGEETKEEGAGQKRKRDTSDGIDLMIFHMICPPGAGGRIGKVK